MLTNLWLFPEVFDAMGHVKTPAAKQTALERVTLDRLVDGTVLYTDSTHLKANANKGKYDLALLQKSRADYWANLDRAIEAERQAHGQKPLKDKEHAPEEKETKISRTDLEAGYMVRDGKPKGFFYLDHHRYPCDACQCA